MVGNASPPPDDSPIKQTTWGDLGKMALFALGLIAACVSFFIWVGGQILGQW